MDIVQLTLNRPEDSSQLIELLDAYSERPNGSTEFQNQLTAQLKSCNNALAFIARDGQRPVGVVLGFVNVYLFRAKPYANVHFIYVRPEQRCHGVARALMQAFERQALEIGCCKINLEVRQSNELAKGLYRALSYTPAVFGPTRDLLEFWEKDLQ